MTRRDFVTRTGLYAASLTVLGQSGNAGAAAVQNSSQSSAAPEDGLHPSHAVPVDKGLEREWIDSLFEAGEQRVYERDELKCIGMPIGGIGTGQLYLGGDGRLLHWDIFNRHFNSAAVNTYPSGRQKLEQPVAHGFALHVRDGDTRTERRLDASGFPNVRFVGEYPIGTVTYPAGEDLPVETTLTAFSPFIPLNAPDSGLPATVLRFSLKNTSEREVKATIAGWLANAVCGDDTPPAGTWHNEVVKEENLTFLHLRMEPKEAAGSEPAEPRRPIVFADFERDDYGDWKAEGNAVGSGPAAGSFGRQQPVSGYEGEQLVNTFTGGDRSTGLLTSPAFHIERRYINFLVGGGNDSQRVGMRLVVDGKVARRAAGKNDERLEWATWQVDDLAGREARLEIYDTSSAPWGHINIDQIEFADEPRAEVVATRDRVDFGTMGLGVVGGEASVVRPHLPVEEPRQGLFDQEEDEDPSATSDAPGRLGAIGQSLTLAPGQTRELSFVIAWHLPNLKPGGRFYANRFDDALAVARYVARELPRLAGQTQAWHDTYYDSTLPHWLLDRLHMPISTLATSTSQWWKNGRFWAWEGVGCCAGTCTHVWNYEQAMARLFPQLEQSVRQMQDFEAEAGFQPLTGLVGFRGEHHMAYAADGQCGTVLKAYREHLVSPDNGFLEKNWPQIRKALEFLAVQDANLDGLIENEQHNTYDIEFFGPNTFVGALYLAALRAAAEMAGTVGDDALAQSCRRAFETGSRLSMERLFNGEYFLQRVNLSRHPLHQYADGCLSDQLFGQNWAHQLGLGYLYPAEAVRKGVESVWRYNWTRDVGPQNEAHPPERVFAEPGEPGLFICTWPKSRHLGDAAVRYKDEVWTGIEYEVAAGLAYDGLVEEALAIVKAVDERYDASKRNPWNEIECGDHYARAMASWGVLLALSGFEYDGPAGRLGFAPRLTPENFRCAFTAAEGWGILEQHREGEEQTNTVTVRWGRLRLNEIDLAMPSADADVAVEIDEREVEATAEPGDREGMVRIRFKEAIDLTEGQSLRVRTP